MPQKTRTSSHHVGKVRLCSSLCTGSQVCLVGRDGSAVLRRLDPVFDPAAVEREVAAICAKVEPSPPANAACPSVLARRPRFFADLAARRTEHPLTWQLDSHACFVCVPADPWQAWARVKQGMLLVQLTCSLHHSMHGAHSSLAVRKP